MLPGALAGILLASHVFRNLDDDFVRFLLGLNATLLRRLLPPKKARSRPAAPPEARRFWG
jgi:uncharacterized membrane protein YfcA